ncbi:MAG: hypothetical protein NZ480_01475 [Bdellovibrionaceae bacterium]|nr:hypothetical protein [Pseudobdellovibrionaceae bacterium]MDW8190374.1 hypothetical protein [Pseudobdellovibrionaceae bacterium]
MTNSKQPIVQLVCSIAFYLFFITTPTGFTLEALGNPSHPSSKMYSKCLRFIYPAIDREISQMPIYNKRKILQKFSWLSGRGPHPHHLRFTSLVRVDVAHPIVDDLVFVSHCELTEKDCQLLNVRLQFVTRITLPDEEEPKWEEND